ncbi:hypothetical protein COCON_G00113880 [Conger conger]|uniref:C2H2-type domain-containing protein n=1 Tax=Conger conger TaxID=82655 RepID=A0A9Q1HXY4_CONCO|nr:hypothetical protein COCON_G00113880 [Conger conger]
MSEALLSFQAQLSGIMETVLKTAVFEITWLVESSFQGEVARSQREAEALRRRLQEAEQRWRVAAGNGKVAAGNGKVAAGNAKVACENCGQVSAEGAERIDRRAGEPLSSQKRVGELTLRLSGVKDRWGVKEEQESLSSCLMDTSHGLPATRDAQLFGKGQLWPCARGGGQPSHSGMSEGGGHGNPEDALSTDSAELLGEPGWEGDPEGPKLARPALGYAAYDRHGVTGGDARGRGLSPPAAGRDGIQIENVVSLSRPQACSARRRARKARDAVALELAPARSAVSPLRSAVSPLRSAVSPLHASAAGLSAPGEAQALQGVAPGDKPISCVYCGKSFSYVSRLKIHLLKHTGEKPYSCSQCGKRFTIARNLERHQHIHWGDAAFCCSQCGKRFKRADHLKVHQRVHTGERPYSCSQCSKRFRFSGDLNTHKRVHTGEKPYCCTLCGTRFSQLRQLKAHQRNHRSLSRFEQLIKSPCLTG